VTVLCTGVKEYGTKITKITYVREFGIEDDAGTDVEKRVS
jgi:hypothetical protein